MIQKELIDILCCPETKQDLTLLSEATLAEINEKIENQSLNFKNGDIVQDKLEAALIRKDEIVVYPIKEGIPVLLIDEGIVLKA